MKGYIFEISFFECFFKVPYTKKYRLSYPLPLPTSIAGIFGSILGIERERIKEIFKDFLFGARIKDGTMFYENVTLVEIDSKSSKKDRSKDRSVEKIMILNNPVYEIAIAGKNYKILDEIKDRINKFKMEFLPFGGQNDFFLKNIKFIKECEIGESDEISGYVQKDLVKNINIIDKKEKKFWILPVKYKIGEDFRKVFFLFTSGKVKLKSKVLALDDIALHPLEKFYFIV